MIRPFLCAVVCAFASACGASRHYALPVSATQASSTYSPIISCAGERNLESNKLEDGVQVWLDDASWVSYGIDVNGGFAMMVVIDDKKVPKPLHDQKFNEARTKGDEIWQCAQSGLSAPAPAPAPAPTPAAAPAPAPAANVVDDCSRLISCQAALVNALCQAGDPGCKASFEVKVSGNDASLCRDALANMGTVVAPFRMLNPAFQMPAECSAGGTRQAAAPAKAQGGVDWAGNWNVAVQYEYSCDLGFGRIERGRESGRWKINVSGQPTALNARVNTSPSGFDLTGSTGANGLQLCGAFPLKGHGGNPSTMNNNVCLIVDAVANASKASGRAEGSYQTSFGNKCKVTSATTELTR
jgi:hypothetical protein